MKDQEKVKLIALHQEGLRLHQEGMKIHEEGLRLLGSGQDGDVSAAGSFNVVDEVAYRHYKAEQEKGSPLTLGESLEIRREIYGPTAVRGSAALFGIKGSNHILYRDVPYGKRRNINQLVYLTEYGLRRAKAYAKAHNLAA